ncbi:MAG: sigma-70 family RNA polymerase sigma factor [Polyangiales bacterium]
MDDIALPPSPTLPGVNDAARARIFTDWTRAHGAALRRVASSYARTAAEQEDLLQQIALALWQALPGFRGACSARTFVYRVAHNQGMHFATRERLRRPHPEGDARLDAATDERPDPERTLDAQRRQARLFEAIRALPVSHRQVITLALEDLPHDEIAAVLGISVNNVNVRLSRARDALRAQMGATP